MYYVPETRVAYIEQRAVVIDRPATLLLASDRLWRLVDHFDVYDAAGLAVAVTGKGLAALGAELRTLEAADPECRHVPRVKPFGDASGLLIDIAPERS